METQLITLVSAHVFLLLTAAIAFYALLLLLLARRGTAKRALLLRSGIGAAAMFVAFLLDVFFLGSYYLGKEGLVTNQNTTMLVPIFVYVRWLLLPACTAGAALLFALVVWKGAHLNPSPEFSRRVRIAQSSVVLAAILAVGAMALVFFGILAP